MAPGWIDVCDGEYGVTLGMRWMREMYPKELAVENGTLRAYVWPPGSRWLDTRRYSRQFGEAESTSYGQGRAIGVSRTTDLFIYFHRGEGPPASVARQFNHPALLVADPDWYCYTRVAGNFHTYDMKGFPKLETALETWIDYMLYHQGLWVWFGHYDFGDFQTVKTRGAGWAFDRGRWAWMNNEALVDWALWLEFLRTGRRDYFEPAEAMSRHILEVDCINSTQYTSGQNVKMWGHRHNVNHWGDGYVGMRVNACTGMKHEYYFTGNLRTKHQLDMVYERDLIRLNRYNSTGDNIGAVLNALLYKWKTGDEEAHKRLIAFVNFCCDIWQKEDFFPYSVTGWDFRESRKYEGEVRPGVTGMFFQNFGAMQTLIALIDLAGHERLKQAIISIADASMRYRTWHWTVCLFYLHAMAYRYTGDQKYLEFIERYGKPQWVNPDRRLWSIRKCVVSLGKANFGAWITHGVPYLMSAIDFRRNDPVIRCDIPRTVKAKPGANRAVVNLDASASEAKTGRLHTFEWILDGKPTATGVSTALAISPCTHRLTLRVADTEG